MRLDLFLFKFGYFTSRSKASQEIKNKSIKINGKIITKPSFEINDNSVLTIEINKKTKWVSRAGLKLEHAFKTFKINPENKIFLDIGSSTGGFTQVLLHYGANFIYAIDVGTSQLDNSLRNNPCIIIMENYNAKNINLDDLKVSFNKHIEFIKTNILNNYNQVKNNKSFEENKFFNENKTFCKYKIINDVKFSKIDINDDYFIPDSFVMDVSFISTKKILLKLFNIIKEDWGIILFKPQFESEGRYLKNGIIKDDKFRKKIINDYKIFLNYNGYSIEKITESPIKGKKGNIEYLMLIKRIKQ